MALKDRQKKYRQSEKGKATRRQRYKRNAEKVAAQHRVAYLELKRAVYQKYGGECACGESRLPALELHHVNHDGQADRQVATGMPYLRALVRDPRRDDLEIRCANCHRCYHRSQIDWRVTL